MSKPSQPRAPRGKLSFSLSAMNVFAIPALPEVSKGANIAKLIMASARRENLTLETGDVLVVAQKIVSKAEGRLMKLSKIKPSPRAARLALKLKNDPRFMEVVLRESRRIVRSERVLIAETRHGFVCANAGVDQSNVPGRDVVTLLPLDPDWSARRLAAALRKQTGHHVAIIISDTFGRPWRLGLTNVAIGAAGVPVLLDLRGTRDRNGKQLHATILAVADELASAAGLLMRKADGCPVVVIRGYRYRPTNDTAACIVRPANEDLFR